MTQHTEADVEAVARAIERADREHAPDGSIDHPEISDWGEHLARAALSTLYPRIEALQEALRPFANAKVLEDSPDEKIVLLPCTVGNIRFAHSVLNQQGEG